MSTAQTEKFIYVSLDANANKYWNISLTDGGDVVTEWGRIGYDGQSKTFPRAGQSFYDSKIREKTKKGYVPQQTLGNTTSKVATVAHSNVASVAKRDIVSNNPIVDALIERLARENVHNILSVTSMQYDESRGSFSTPLGIVTRNGIDSARDILIQIGDLVNQKRFANGEAMRLANDYLKIVPQNLGMARFTPESLFPDLVAVQKQNSILDSLEVSLTTVMTAPKDDDTVAEEPKVFRVKMEYVEDGKVIDRIRRKYNDTRQRIHQASSLDVKTVYSIEIGTMHDAFEKQGRLVGNVMELWHGTKISNVLSILKSGLQVSPPSSAAITGKLFGNGVYASDQSTKALNYAAGYWSGARNTNCFMFLGDFAMGKPYVPRNAYDGTYPKNGFDSTFAKANQSGILNNEMIVYKNYQLNLTYLIEFSTGGK